MAHAFSTLDGFVRASETVALAANATGSAVDTAGSSLAMKGKSTVYAQADESAGVTAVLEYTMDSAAISIGGIGADPNGRTLGSQTWVGAKATEGDANASGVMGDGIREAFFIPANAEYIRILYSVADGTSAIDEATVVEYDGAVPGAGFSITGLGADPS